MPNRDMASMHASTLLLLAARGVVFGLEVSSLVHIDAQLPQVGLGHVDLGHELLVRLGNVVEGEDAPAKAEEEHGSKGNKGPEGEDRDDLFLDQSGERDQFEEQGEVEGRDEEGKGDGLLSARHGGRRGLGRFCLAAQID
jgi:hypothetical protein